MVNIYGLSTEKVELLLLSADDEMVEEAKDEDSKKLIRKNMGIEEEDFLIMTGGKIDESKYQTLLLMEAVLKINKKNIKLVVFG